MHLIETKYKQRQSDGKWIALSRVHDHENAYVYFSDAKQKITITPDIWIITGVYDYEIEFKK